MARFFSGRELEGLCRSVCESDESIVVNQRAVASFASSQIQVEDVVPTAPPDALTEEDAERTAALLICWNAINFSYYPDDGQPRWRWLAPDGKEIGGDDEANGVVAALSELNKSSDMPLASHAFLQQIDAAMLNEHIFKPAPGAGNLPLAEARAAALREVGAALERRGCTPMGFVRAADRSAAKLVTMLVEEFPSYADVQRPPAIVSDREDVVELRFHKRAQLCASMLHGAGVASGFTDIDCLSVFADYRLPQLFRASDVRILELGGPLLTKIDEGRPIARDSEDEVKLRAATVWAAALVGEEVRKRAKVEVTQAQLDYYLWKLAVRRDAAGELPVFHRTRCTAY